MKMIVIATLMFLLVIGMDFAYAHLNHVYFELSNHFSSLAESVETKIGIAVKQLSMIDEQWKKAENVLTYLLTMKEFMTLN